MSTISFTVTDRPLDELRLGNDQDFTLSRYTNVKPPQPSFNRSYARSLDRKSGRGTLVSSSTEITIDFVVSTDDEAEFEEMLYSVADYQIAVLDLTDRPAIAKAYKIVLIGDSFPIVSKGCSWITASLTFQATLIE